MKDLFQFISDRIDTVEAIRWIDFDLGQLDEETPPVSYPCALIAFSNIQWVPLAQLVQQGEVTIVIRVAFKVFERTHSKAQQSFRAVGLAHLDTLDAIHTALNGQSGACWSGLIRTGFSNEQRADLRVYTLTYTTLYTDEPMSNFTPWQDIDGLNSVDLCVQEDFE